MVSSGNVPGSLRCSIFICFISFYPFSNPNWDNILSLHLNTRLIEKLLGWTSGRFELDEALTSEKKRVSQNQEILEERPTCSPCFVKESQRYLVDRDDRLGEASSSSIDEAATGDSLRHN